MKIELTQKLFQTYSNKNESIRVDILYNNTFDFFYFEIYKEGVLICDTTRIVNNYSDEFVSFSSLTADYATFELVSTFKIEIIDV